VCSDMVFMVLRISTTIGEKYEGLINDSFPLKKWDGFSNTHFILEFCWKKNTDTKTIHIFIPDIHVYGNNTPLLFDGEYYQSEMIPNPP
jgi:hypothetical protein